MGRTRRKGSYCLLCLLAFFFFFNFLPFLAFLCLFCDFISLYFPLFEMLSAVLSYGISCSCFFLFRPLDY